MSTFVTLMSPLGLLQESLSLILRFKNGLIVMTTIIVAIVVNNNGPGNGRPSLCNFLILGLCHLMRHFVLKTLPPFIYLGDT